MSGRFDGKVALISGGARGQGALEARMIAAEGGRVMLGDVLHQEGRAAAAALPDCGYAPLDVSDEHAWAAAVAATVERFGRLDILVNNAGIYRRALIEDCTVADYMQVVSINQLGVFLGMRAAIPAMKARGGSIVNISSAAGLIGSPGIVAYTATKWAVRGMTKTAALELAHYGIRVNSVHAGLIDTDMARVAVGPERVGALSELVPMGRVGTVAEAAKLVLFLASDDSSYCTGSEFTVDGGNTAGKRYRPPA